MNIHRITTRAEGDAAVIEGSEEAIDALWNALLPQAKSVKLTHSDGTTEIITPESAKSKNIADMLSKKF